MDNYDTRWIIRICRRRIVTSDGCWIFTGHLHVKTRYGIAGYKGGTCIGHRKLYELLFGPVPLGKELHHTCRKRACFNYAHLQVVTHQENVRLDTGATALTCRYGHTELRYKRDGQRYCIACNRIRARVRYKLNRERVLARMKEKYWKNPRQRHRPSQPAYNMHTKLYKQAWYMAHKERYTAYVKRYKERKAAGLVKHHHPTIPSGRT